MPVLRVQNEGVGICYSSAQEMAPLYGVGTVRQTNACTDVAALKAYVSLSASLPSAGGFPL